MADFWPDVEPGSNSSDGGSIKKGRKDQEIPDDHEQEEVVSVPRRNPRRLKQGDQRALRQI